VSSRADDEDLRLTQPPLHKKTQFSAFPRHLSPDFLQYIDEAPEMTSHDEEPKKAKTTEGKLNHE